jgi:hypothetical protein
MKTDFLYASIADTQGTIRSIDVRAGFLFLVLFLPLSMLDKIAAIYGLPPQLTCVMHVWISFAIGLWLLAIAALFRCVVTIDNPTAHVLGGPAKGSFYGGDLFEPSTVHIFWNCAVLSSRDVDEERANLPKDSADLERELVFEKIKLVYIRAIKLKRFVAAASLTLAWLTTSGLFAVYTRVFA